MTSSNPLFRVLGSTGEQIVLRLKGRADMVVVCHRDFSKSELLKLVYGAFPITGKVGAGPVGTLKVVPFTLPALSAGNKQPPAVMRDLKNLISLGKYPKNKGSRSASVSHRESLSYELGLIWGSNDSGSFGPNSRAKVQVNWENGRTGSTNPYWKSQILSGKTATTGLSAHRTAVNISYGFMSLTFRDERVHRDNQQQMVTGSLTTFSLPNAGVNGVLLNNCDTGALAKLREQLYQLQHDADIGETLGEYKQLLSLIGKPLQGVRDLLELYQRRAAEIITNVQRRYGRPLSRLDAAQVRDINAALGRLYLEFTFGIKPLLYDIAGCLVAAIEKRNSVKAKISASYKDDKLVSDTSQQETVSSYLAVNKRTVMTERCTVRYQVGVNPAKVDLDLPWLQRIGLVPERFIPTVYAVLPFSWLVDYFLSINVVIDTLCADISMVTWQNKTVRTESVTEITVMPDHGRAALLAGSMYKSSSGAPAVVRLARTDTTRIVPTNVLAFPSLKVPSSWKPWANIGALLASWKVAGKSPLASVILAAKGISI